MRIVRSVFLAAMLLAALHSSADRLDAQGKRPSGEAATSRPAGAVAIDRSKGGATVREVDADEIDRAMNAAIGRARETVPQFLPRLQNPPPGQTYLGVEVLVMRGNYHEWLWLGDVRYENGRVVGRSRQDGSTVGVSRGDTLSAEPGKLGDWMTVENGRACGGFTTRVMLAVVSPEQRERYLREKGIPRMPPGDAVCDDDEPAP